MMFSDVDIRAVIKAGGLVIEPFFDHCIRPSGVTLHLGSDLLKPLPGKVVDVKNKVIPDYETILISMEQPYELKPGGFVLGHTYERITVGSNIGFLIEGRSTLARVGLTIVQTAMLVYPGHRDRTVTLELANHGPNSILLYPKMKIARAAIFELRSPTAVEYDTTGKYKGQDLGPPIVEDEFLREKK